jgi:hypothetical protein
MEYLFPTPIRLSKESQHFIILNIGPLLNLAYPKTRLPTLYSFIAALYYKQ